MSQLPESVTPDHRVVVVHRVGAVVVAAAIAVFGVLGFVGGLSFFDTDGAPVLGMSSNGLLSTISLVTAVVLLAAAARGGRFSSTVMIVVGSLFIVSAFVNLGLMQTSYNLLAFRLPNVFFSIVAGLVLLTLGSYGRVSAKLPADNPYRLERDSGDGSGPATAEEARQTLPSRPSTREEAAADAAMAEASRAMAAGVATDEQRRRIVAIDSLRSHEERRERWLRLDREDGANRA